jgi:hypothetical protein
MLHSWFNMVDFFFFLRRREEVGKSVLIWSSSHEVRPLYGVIINDFTIVGGCALCFRCAAPLRPLVVTNIYNDPVYVLFVFSRKTNSIITKTIFPTKSTVSLSGAS